MDEKSIPAAKAVLGYATPDADGLPEFVPEAETLISSGEGPKSLRSVFRQTDQAVRYYSKSLARRYSEASLATGCACGNQEAPFVFQLSWSIKSPFRHFEMNLSISEPETTCLTLHALCGDCFVDWEHRINRYSWVRSLLGILGFLWVMIFLVGRLVQHLAGVRDTTLIQVWLILIVPLLLFRALFAWLPTRSYPEPVRAIVRKGVKLKGISCVFKRVDGKLHAMM